MKERLFECLAIFGAVVFLISLLLGIVSTAVDICRWTGYRCEIKQIQLEKERLELETMKLRIERIKEEKE